jgi:molybdate transport system substrate-binding protein
MDKRRQAVWMASLAAMLASLTLLAGCRTTDERKPDERIELLVSAAVSLQRSMDRIGEAFEQAHPDIRITMNYGSSGTLRQQIAEGAPADLFISADTVQMNRLADDGLIARQAVLLGNRLTVVVPADRSDNLPETLEDLAAGEYRAVAIGDPDTVPAGAYAAEALRHAGLLETLEPKLVYGKDVRQVLTYVESGNADAGFVYRTDALLSGAAREAFTLPDDLHAPIRYPAGIVKATAHPEAAARFFAFLTGDAARRIFEADGFVFLYSPDGESS